MFKIIRLQHKQRHCLKCGHSFIALGPFNRICGRCKRQRDSGTLRVHAVALPWSDFYLDQ